MVIRLENIAHSSGKPLSYKTGLDAHRELAYNLYTIPYIEG